VKELDMQPVVLMGSIPQSRSCFGPVLKNLWRMLLKEKVCAQTRQDPSRYRLMPQELTAMSEMFF
jgi:hypothetical protein